MEIEIAYYEDIEVGHKAVVGEYEVEKEEMLEFSRKWDPREFHVDEKAAASYPFGEVIASSNYTLSIITRLTALYENPRPASIALLEMERVRLAEPVKAGDRLTVTVERIGKKESRSSSDRGIVRSLVEAVNQANRVALSYISVVLVSKRPAGEGTA